MDMEKRIIDIETNLAHHNEQITQMSDIITDQWKQIDLLKRQLVRVMDKISQFNDDDAQGQNDSKTAIEQPS